MKAAQRRLILATTIWVAGCRPTPVPVDPVSGTGLAETALGRSLVENAINVANSWIGSDFKERLVPAWETGSPIDPKNAIPVYTISDLNAPANYMVAVPAHCRCVFVQPRAYQAWLDKRLSHRGVPLEISEERLLAFILLHECGHIAHGDPGEFDGTGSGSLNTDMNVEKQRELNADAFAVQELKGATTRMKDTTAWLNALNATKDLSNLSFEMDGARMLDHPGHDAYYDTGYTHPNFELRLLTVNDQISGTALSHQLLDNFVNHRTQQDPILYQAPSLFGADKVFTSK